MALALQSSQESSGDFGIDYASPWRVSTPPLPPQNKAAGTTQVTFMWKLIKSLRKSRKEKNPGSGRRLCPRSWIFRCRGWPSCVEENGYTEWPGFDPSVRVWVPLKHESIQLGVTYRSWVLNSQFTWNGCSGERRKQGAHFIKVRGIGQTCNMLWLLPGHSTITITRVTYCSCRCKWSGLQMTRILSRHVVSLSSSRTSDQTISHHWSDGSSTVIIPVPLGGTVIGGTKGAWTTGK